MSSVQVKGIADSWIHQNSEILDGVLAGDEHEINSTHLLREVVDALLAAIEANERYGTESQSKFNSFYEDRKRFEVDLIRRALKQCGGNQTRAASLLGLRVTTLNSKIKRYNMMTGHMPFISGGEEI